MNKSLLLQALSRIYGLRRSSASIGRDENSLQLKQSRDYMVLFSRTERCGFGCEATLEPGGCKPNPACKTYASSEHYYYSLCKPLGFGMELNAAVPLIASARQSFYIFVSFQFCANNNRDFSWYLIQIQMRHSLTLDGHDTRALLSQFQSSNYVWTGTLPQFSCIVTNIEADAPTTMQRHRSHSVYILTSLAMQCAARHCMRCHQHTRFH